MPRLIPRLVDRIKKDTNREKYFPYPESRQVKSLHKPLPPRPSFHPADHQRSILLNHVSHNPITSSRHYEYHKTLPPRVTLPQNAPIRRGETDSPREMSKEERRWWGSPYLRMLSSPLRLCIQSDQYLPSDLLIRLTQMRLPGSRFSQEPAVTLVPDGLQHTKFTSRKSGTGFFILCQREAVARMLKDRSYRRTTKGLHVSMHSRLADHIAHSLRLRVLQELELLADRLRFQIKTPNPEGHLHTSIRRLTRDEFSSVKMTGIAPFDDAVAVLVLPPVNKNPITKERLQGSMSAMPPKHDCTPPKKPLPPLSILIPSSAGPPGEMGPSNLLPRHHVPLYNGLAAFPYASQRVALYDRLMRILALESKRRHKSGFNTSIPRGSKGSHAFLLSSDSEIVKRGDMAAVAIALWRLRMYEGGGSEDYNDDGWSIRSGYDVQILV